MTNLRNLMSVSVVILLLVGLLTGCSDRDPLLGKWQEPTSGVILEIKEDGDLVISMKSVSVAMTYELEDPDIMIFRSETDDSIPEQKMVYRIEEDQLIITVDGIETIFTRVD